MQRIFASLILISLVLALSGACTELQPPAPAEENILDGPVEGLNYEQSRRFLAGDRAFNDEIFTSAKGLGPIFVASSCASCHAGDGKGHPFTTLTRFGQTDGNGNAFLAAGGPQLQNRAIPGYLPESIPAGATFSRFTPPANTGLGYLEAVEDAYILAMADPEDSDGDGISGAPNWINVPAYVRFRPGAITQGGRHIGRFGKKAAVYDLMQQTVNAYHQDMGIASLYAPYDICTGAEIDPEISTQTVNDVVFYLQALKAPPARNQGDQAVAYGKTVFMSAGCGSCHKPVLKTGPSPITALSGKEFRPYTDLLLHDMGPELDDGYTEGSASTAEWRTAPLWGLGLSPSSQGGKYFLMHDGRARSIEEAILLHGGEAARSRENYGNMPSADKSALIRFLESL